MSEGAVASREDRTGCVPGHSSPASGSSQRKVCSSPPSYSFVTRYSSVTSSRAQKPCATPGGMSTPSPGPNSSLSLAGTFAPPEDRRSTRATCARPAVSDHRSHWRRWKCMPRSTPARERDRLACTKAGVPSGNPDLRQSSANEPRTSVFGTVLSRNAPTMSVGCHPIGHRIGARRTQRRTSGQIPSAV